MAKEYKTSCAFIPIEKAELDQLRAAMKVVYIRMGGEHELTESSQQVYDGFEGYFKSRLQELDINVTLTTVNSNKKNSSRTQKNDPTGPGCAFLRNLFYAKKDVLKMKCHQYNFDFCYIFAYGMTRREYLAQARSQPSMATSNNYLKVVVSSLSTYASEMERMKTYVETKLGHSVEKDIRDMSSQSIGSLVKFHSASANSNTPTIYVIGKNHFFNEDFVSEFNHIRKKLKDRFLESACIVFLDDVYGGEYDLKNAAGILKINEFWHDQIKYMDERMPQRGKKLSNIEKQEQKALENIKDSKSKTQAIIKEMEALIKFLLKETRMMPYSYFINHSTKEEVLRWLNKGAA